MHSVQLTNSAAKGYRDSGQYKKKINELFDALKTNPFPFHDFDLAKLKGLDNDYRIRIGELRIKYKVVQEENAIIVYYVGKREGAYG